MSYTRTNKPYYSNKPRSFEKAERWNHDGFDRLENDERKKDYNENRKTKNVWNKDKESNYSGNKYPERDNSEKENVTAQKEKWQHDKFDETDKQSSKETTSKQARQKRPDQVLYRPPRQRGQIPESKGSGAKETDSVADTPRLKSKNYFDLDTTADLDSRNDDERYHEERCSVSSESTAHSDKAKLDEYISKYGSNQKDLVLSSIDVSPADQSMVAYPVFELCLILADGKPVELKVFESNEEEIEGLLDKFCELNEIFGDLRLHLKIYIVKCLRMQQVFDDKKLEALYDSLLEANYKLLQGEFELQKNELNYSMIQGENEGEGFKDDEQLLL